jgi:hypothetical protein
MLEYYFIPLMVAVLFAGCCAGYLYLRLRQRPRDYPQERQSPGHGIDATYIADRVHRVRSDYVSELQARPRACPTGLLASVRRAISRLPYFKAHVRREPSIDHDTENHA